MAAIVWSDVTGLAAELATFPAAGQTAILGAVNTLLNVASFDGENGPITKLARMYLAAHLAASAALGGTGPLISETEGSLSRGYAIPSGHGAFATTTYGSMYWMLLRPVVRGPVVL